MGKVKRREKRTKDIGKKERRGRVGRRKEGVRKVRGCMEAMKKKRRKADSSNIHKFA